MSNKPVLPNAYVDVNNKNLGSTPKTLSGVNCFAGIAVGGSESAETIVTIGNLNDVRAKIGYGELADALIDYFNNGGRRAFAYSIVPTTEATIGAVTPTRVSTSTGTIALAKDGANIVPNDFKIKIVITKTGDDGVARFKYSTDDGVNYSPEITVPVSTTYVIPTTNIEATFTKGAGVIFWEKDDEFVSTVTAPSITTAKVEGAVDAFIASDNYYSAIFISSPVDLALALSLGTKMSTAEGNPNYLYAYVAVRPALSTSASQAVTQATTFMAGIANDRVQVITGEMVITRAKHNDQSDRNVLGVIAGRRSALAISEDIGLVEAGQLSSIVSIRTGWTSTTIEELDGILTVTVRKFKGLAGYYPTNGYMSDPFSDVTKDARRLVLDKASYKSRVASLQKLKVKIDPSDVVSSGKSITDVIDRELGLMVGNGDMVDGRSSIPDGQDILTTEEIKVLVEVIPYGHASWIGIEIGLINPLTA